MLKPHQQRVVAEKGEVEERLIALVQFLDGDLYRGLDEAEKNRLRQQRYFMSGYCQVLRDRIDAFQE
jgi:hypothetical protein